MIIVSTFIVSFIIIILLLYFYTFHQVQKLPFNSPENFLSINNTNQETQTVICFGDSITHGQVSYNYVNILMEKMSKKGFNFVNAGVNGNTYTYVGYAFAEKQGYSKFGKYTGNNDADGTFVYTGFKPAWLMVKRSSAVQGWLIWDSKRSSVNTASAPLTANETSSEDTPDADLLSNGFKLRTADTSNNAVSTYIYMAFAENPFVSSKGVPTTAR